MSEILDLSHAEDEGDYQSGWDDGFEQGHADEANQIAVRMLKADVPAEQIEKFTRLPQDWLKRLTDAVGMLKAKVPFKQIEAATKFTGNELLRFRLLLEEDL